jgi:hypothetical protein
METGKQIFAEGSDRLNAVKKRSKTATPLNLGLFLPTAKSLARV